ncbi:MAG TPA: hypothetical protein VK576_07320, partial [Thermoleophilia bacterium]|nr:hypothetical protein [Thermoleophilia bacterium]
VKDLETGVIEITTQNHGFAVRDEGRRRGADARITHVNLNDDTVEGLAAPALNAFSVQYHPESTPGPHDSLYLFERFTAAMRAGASTVPAGAGEAAGSGAEAPAAPARRGGGRRRPAEVS